MPGGRLEIQVRNRVGEGQLNEGCGAEWAQKVNTPDSYLQAVAFAHFNNLAKVDKELNTCRRAALLAISLFLFSTAFYK